MPLCGAVVEIESTRDIEIDLFPKGRLPISDGALTSDVGCLPRNGWECVADLSHLVDLRLGPLYIAGTGIESTK
jgi:hypothetical protein